MNHSSLMGFEKDLLSPTVYYFTRLKISLLSDQTEVLWPSKLPPCAAVMSLYVTSCKTTHHTPCPQNHLSLYHPVLALLYHNMQIIVACMDYCSSFV